MKVSQYQFQEEIIVLKHAQKPEIGKLVTLSIMATVPGLGIFFLS